LAQLTSALNTDGMHAYVIYSLPLQYMHTKDCTALHAFLDQST